MGRSLGHPSILPNGSLHCLKLGRPAAMVQSMALLTRSKSRYLHAHRAADGWGPRLAEEVDQAIHQLGADREVINVAVTPLATSYNNGESPTSGVIVTVVWREPQNS